jgi:hypothetical protein
MAYEPGGYADKLGNRYEGRWVVKQLLHLLNEEIRSVTLEPIGDDEHGVDLLIEQNDGAKQYQQCKARNSSKECWNLTDLNSRGILAKAQFQLGRDLNYEFAFVSGIPGTLLGDVCDSARKSNGNPEDFYKYQIQDIGKTRQDIFEKYCEYNNLNHNDVNNRATAFDYLRRTHIILWPDNQGNFDGLSGWASILIDGQPNVIIAFLADFAQDNIRKKLVANDVWSALSIKGFNPRKLANDSRITPAVIELQNVFENSIKPRLIANGLICRDETKTLLSAIDDNDLIILHGSAGYGKSGVLYELTEILKKQGNPYLPIRLDRHEPRNTPKQFGIDIGLPESPVLCLASLLSTQTGVLILDQLDALRWTSAHSPNSLDVCKAMIREAISLKKTGKPISVILSCRTFDLEHDPEIKQWLENEITKSKCSKIDVKILSEETVKTIVDSTGINFSDLSNQQKSILRSVQHLAMWVIIKQNGQVPQFQSGTQLMREFWKDRYQQLSKSGIDGQSADAVLDILVDYMEQNGKIFAPCSLISDEKIYTELHTLGIVGTDGNRITFCHQSYLDFRIADRLLRHIRKNQGTIVNWLGPKEKQSLFRREQLRQILLLLCDEDPNAFLMNIKDILGSKTVRFHLKHLTLEIVGQIEQPSQPLCEYLLELFSDAYWQSHIIDTVFLGKAQYIQLLINKKLASEWLDSNDENKRNKMLWLLRTVSEIIPDQISEFLSPYINYGGDWPQFVLGAIGWSEENDSNSMFELRLKLARMGQVRDYIFWSKMAKKHPIRTIHLIEAVISTWDGPSLEENTISKRGRQSRLEQWSLEDLQTLKNVASNNAVETWDLLMPHVERLTAIKMDNHGNLNDWRYGDRFDIDSGRASISRGIVEILCEAGCVLAKNKPSDFLKRAEKLNKSISPITQEILITSYTLLSSEYSDYAICYLLEDTSRFQSGTGYREPEGMPTVRLIEAQSTHCSDDLFKRLENAIIRYHSPDEKRDAEYCLKTWKQGYFDDYWGRTQYFLLPALCPNRRSEETNGLIGVLQRRYADYSKDRFLKGGRITGGWVGSPLPSKKLHRISDKTWLGIINNKKIMEEHFHRYKQIDSDHVAESSATHFADDIRMISKRFPERFAKLALQFPKDVHPAYLAAILDGIKATKPEEIPEDEKSSWKPANVETIEKIFEKYKLGDNHSVAHSFCWLITTRPGEKWSNKAINQLLGYAVSHPDPEPGKLNVRRANSPDGEFNVDDLRQNAINCIRGIAGLAIGALLWEHPDLLDQLKPGLEHLVNDLHPAVRVAALEACLPVLNINIDLAVDLFIQACKEDLRVAATPYAVRYFNHCIPAYSAQLSPIIIQMVNSENEEIAEEGATEVCARWIFHGLFEQELEKCKTGSIAQRKGVAKVASHLLCKQDYTEKCKALLEPLFNDSDHDVRQKTRIAFHNNVNLLNLPDIHPFIETFIKSQAFADDPTGTLYTFEDYPNSLVPYAESIFIICEQFVGPLATLSKDPSLGISHDVSDVSSLILRLYEQAKEHNPAIMNKCLDAWDVLFEHRIGYIRDMLKAIDR